jgi:hypothetical protein
MIFSGRGSKISFNRVGKRSFVTTSLLIAYFPPGLISSTIWFEFELIG